MAQSAFPERVGTSVEWDHDGVTTLMTKIDPRVWRAAIGADEWVLTEVDTDRYDVARDVAPITPVRSVDEAFEHMLGHSPSASSAG